MRKRITLGDVLSEVRGLRNTTETRLDSLHQRIDTLVDSISDLRRDLVMHTHED